MEDGSLELKTYWRIFLKWWWLFALGTVLAAAAAYFLYDEPTPIYKTTVQVAVQQNRTPGILTAADLNNSASLAASYIDLIETRPVLEEIANKLPYGFSPGQVGRKIEARSRRNVIHITATDSDPVVAANVANTTAETFINTLLDRQLSQLVLLQEALSQYGIPSDQLIGPQATNLGLLNIIEYAFPPSSPSNSDNRTRNILIAAVLGFLIAGFGVVAIEYLDHRIKSEKDLESLTGLSSVGSIPRYKTPDGPIHTTSENNGQGEVLAESYRYIHTNLQFAVAGKPRLKSILVTSSIMDEGKTTIATHLASSFASEGKSVILAEFDTGNPSLQMNFRLGQRKGLAQVLQGSLTMDEALASTAVEGLRVLPFGLQESYKNSIIKSDDFRILIKDLESKADTVIIDGPPLLAVTDPLLIASVVDGVLFVVDARRTSRELVSQAVERLNQVNPAPAFVGAVLNGVRSKDQGAQYYQKYFRNGHKSFNIPSGFLFFTKKSDQPK